MSGEIKEKICLYLVSSHHFFYYLALPMTLCFRVSILLTKRPLFLNYKLQQHSMMRIVTHTVIKYKMLSYLF